MLFPAVYWRWKWTVRFLQMCCFFLPWSRFRSCPKSDAEVDGGPVMSFIFPLTAPQLFSLLKKPHQYWVLKVGWSVLWNSGTLSDCPPLMMPSNPCSRCCVRTCTAAPLLFIAIPSCGFLPFYSSVCKFTFLTSMNLQFVPHPPEPFTSCRERSNAWFSNLWHPQTFHRT